MFSNDNNIETIVQLTDAIKVYLKEQAKYVRLDIVDKTVRILTVLIMTFFVLILTVLMFIFLALALAFALETYMGLPLAFVCVAGIVVLVVALLFIYKGRLIERPLVRLLASILLEE